MLSPNDACGLIRIVDMSTVMNSPLLEVHSCGKSYGAQGREPLIVLEEAALTLSSGEIVGLLGRSGSGKSTLLRIISGLISPTNGEVHFMGEPVHGPTPGMATVFQTFALFPWL